MTAKEKVQALLGAANAATGESDADLTSAVGTLIDGYGQGGAATQAELDSIAGLVGGIATPSTPASIEAQADDLIADANAATGEADETLTDAVGSLIAGYDQGGATVESGEIAMHTGANPNSISIPLSDGTKSHYAVTVKAKNAWFKVDGVWTERTGLDFSGYSSAGQLVCAAVTSFYPKPATNGTIYGETTRPGLELTGQYYAQITASSGAIAQASTTSYTISIADNVLTLSCGAAFCRTGVGITYEYTVVGWN